MSQIDLMNVQPWNIIIRHLVLSLFKSMYFHFFAKIVVAKLNKLQS